MSIRIHFRDTEYGLTARQTCQIHIHFSSMLEYIKKLEVIHFYLTIVFLVLQLPI